MHGIRWWVCRFLSEPSLRLCLLSGWALSEVRVPTPNPELRFRGPGFLYCQATLGPEAASTEWPTVTSLDPTGPLECSEPRCPCLELGRLKGHHVALLRAKKKWQGGPYEDGVQALVCWKFMGLQKRLGVGRRRFFRTPAKMNKGLCQAQGIGYAQLPRFRAR